MTVTKPNHDEGTPFLSVYLIDDKPSVFVDLANAPSNPRQIGIFMADVITTVALSLHTRELHKDGNPMSLDSIRSEMFEFVRKEWERPTTKIDLEVPS